MTVNLLALANNAEFDASRADEEGLSALNALVSEAESLVGILKRHAEMYEECGSYETAEEMAGKGNTMTRAADNARRLISRMEQTMKELTENGAKLYTLSGILPQLVVMNAEKNAKED